eukprot:gnl/Ergobibamus_cyprinoides/337.p1 GENE.gnl/Ergobibamus_cyprinoides/337~~gnl/Ergobibamus_cyprinoides/337.p1  ORF type:complete len:366 (+),score=114.37 gnl/Ergobibamus_cyprinoides/337:34-1098(+)
MTSSRPSPSSPPPTPSPVPLLVSGCADGQVKVWDAASGRLIVTLSDHHRSAEALLVVGNLLITASSDRAVILYNLAPVREAAAAGERLNRAALRPFAKIDPAHETTVYALAWAEGRLLSGGADHKIKVWDLSDPSNIQCVQEIEESYWVKSLAVDPAKPNWVYSASRNHLAKRWSLSTGECLRVFQGHQDEVGALEIATLPAFDPAASQPVAEAIAAGMAATKARREAREAQGDTAEAPESTAEDSAPDAPTESAESAVFLVTGSLDFSLRRFGLDRESEARAKADAEAAALGQGEASEADGEHSVSSFHSDMDDDDLLDDPALQDLQGARFRAMIGDFETGTGAPIKRHCCQR